MYLYGNLGHEIGHFLYTAAQNHPYGNISKGCGHALLVIGKGNIPVVWLMGLIYKYFFNPPANIPILLVLGWE